MRQEGGEGVKNEVERGKKTACVHLDQTIHFLFRFIVLEIIMLVDMLENVLNHAQKKVITVSKHKCHNSQSWCSCGKWAKSGQW